MRLIEVHGWRSSPKKFDGINRHLTQSPVVGFEYDADGTWRKTQFNNRKHSGQLACVCGNDPVNMIAHSNGNPLALRAIKDGAKVKRLVMVNPALDADWPLPLPSEAPELEMVFVLHSKYDLAVRFGNVLPFMEWGKMGAIGSRWEDERLVSIDCAELGKNRGIKKKHLRHSGILDHYREVWGPAIDSLFIAQSDLDIDGHKKQFEKLVRFGS